MLFVSIFVITDCNAEQVNGVEDNYAMIIFLVQVLHL